MLHFKIRRSRRLIAGLAGIALLTAACGSATTTETAETPGAETPAAETPTTAAPSTEAPAGGTIVELALDGGQLDWNSLEGTDTVLWFWAPW